MDDDIRKVIEYIYVQVCIDFSCKNCVRLYQNIELLLIDLVLLDMSGLGSGNECVCVVSDYMWL